MHGAAFEFLRNSVFDARPFNATTLPAFKMNNFGASIGGSAIKNKMFFFAVDDAIRQVLAQPLNGLVPTEAYRAQALLKSPVLAPIINAFPLGTFPTKDPNALAYFRSGRQAKNEDSGTIRGDYLLSD